MLIMGKFADKMKSIYDEEKKYKKESTTRQRDYDSLEKSQQDRVNNWQEREKNPNKSIFKEELAKNKKKKKLGMK